MFSIISFTFITSIPTLLLCTLNTYVPQRENQDPVAEVAQNDKISTTTTTTTILRSGTKQI